MSKKEYEAAKYETKNPISCTLIYFFQETIRGLLLELDYQTLHEVGCGDGYNMRVLASVKKAVCSGSDIEERALTYAKKRNYNVSFINASVYNLPFQDDCFDVVVICEVLEHLENPIKALLEVKRISKKYCLLSVPYEPLWRILNIFRGKYLKNFGNTPSHINHWSKKQFINLIQPYFKINKVKISFPWIIILARK